MGCRHSTGEVLGNMDRRTRKIMTMNGCMHTRSLLQGYICHGRKVEDV